MALNFGQSLGVSGNIKLTDVELVKGGYRTLQNSSDTGSIPIGRLEDGQVFYIENEDKLLKVSESLADNENTFVNSYTFLDFSWPKSILGQHFFNASKSHGFKELIMSPSFIYAQSCFFK